MASGSQESFKTLLKSIENRKGCLYLDYSGWPVAWSSWLYFPHCLSGDHTSLTQLFIGKNKRSTFLASKPWNWHMETRRSTINCLEVPASESMCGANIAVLKNAPYALQKKTAECQGQGQNPAAGYLVSGPSPQSGWPKLPSYYAQVAGVGK